MGRVIQLGIDASEKTQCHRGGRKSLALATLGHGTERGLKGQRVNEGGFLFVVPLKGGEGKRSVSGPGASKGRGDIFHDDDPNTGTTRFGG